MSTDMYRTDSLISFYKDTMICHPVSMKQILFKTRQSVSDSICYYKLTMFAGFCYYHNHQMDSAMLLSKSTLDFCMRQDSTLSRISELEAHTYNYLAVMLQEMNNRDSAITYLHKAYNALQRAKDRTKLPDVCINLADNYAQSGNFPLATGFYRKALALSDSLQMGKELNHVIYCGLARIYTDINNFPLADHYYRLAEQRFDSISAYEQFFYANTRGNYYYITKKYSSALPWFYKANKIAQSFNRRGNEAITESNLGEIYLLLGQNDSAQYYLDKAGKFFLTPDANESTKFYFNGLYASLALSKGELDKAEHLLSTSDNTAKINPTYMYLHNKRMEELYTKKKDFKKAYIYNKRVQSYNDSLHNIKAINNIAEIDSRYKQDTILLKRDVVIAQGEAQILQFKNISFILAFTLATLIMITTLAIIYTRKRREQQYAKQMAAITKLRMENVRNRISPHFIFNVLNIVMPALRQYDELANPLRLLIQSIRNNLLVSDKIAIKLQEEIEIVKNFLELKKSISTNFPIIQWDISNGIDKDMLIPSMIMQIPIENAIKYAFDSNDQDRLSIVIKEESKRLFILIEDNGVGYSPERYTDHSKGTGTGLKIVFRTIELINTKNQHKIEFNMQNLEDLSIGTHGTRVSIIIPLTYNYNL